MHGAPIRGYSESANLRVPDNFAHADPVANYAVLYALRNFPTDVSEDFCDDFIDF